MIRIHQTSCKVGFRNGRPRGDEDDDWRVLNGKQAPRKLSLVMWEKLTFSFNDTNRQRSCPTMAGDIEDHL